MEAKNCHFIKSMPTAPIFISGNNEEDHCSQWESEGGNCGHDHLSTSNYEKIKPNSEVYLGNLSLQDFFAPTSTCFGCGPKNPSGLKIKSFADGKKVITQWSPEITHEAFAFVLCGGIIVYNTWD